MNRRLMYCIGFICLLGIEQANAQATVTHPMLELCLESDYVVMGDIRIDEANQGDFAKSNGNSVDIRLTYSSELEVVLAGEILETDPIDPSDYVITSPSGDIQNPGISVISDGANNIYEIRITFQVVDTVNQDFLIIRGLAFKGNSSAVTDTTYTLRRSAAAGGSAVVTWQQQEPLFANVSFFNSQKLQVFVQDNTGDTIRSNPAKICQGLLASFSLLPNSFPVYYWGETVTRSENLTDLGTTTKWTIDPIDLNSGEYVYFLTETTDGCFTSAIKELQTGAPPDVDFNLNQFHDHYLHPPTVKPLPSANLHPPVSSTDLLTVNSVVDNNVIVEICGSRVMRNGSQYTFHPFGNSDFDPDFAAQCQPPMGLGFFTLFFHFFQ